MIYFIGAWIAVGLIASIMLNSYWIGRFPSSDHRGAFAMAYIIGPLSGPIMLFAVLVSFVIFKIQGEAQVFYPWRFWCGN